MAVLDDLVELAAHAARREADDIAFLQVGGGDIELAAVDGDEAVADDLARLVARIGEAEAVDDVVEARFEQADKVLARNAGAADGFLVVAHELLFEHAVGDAGALLLAQLEAAVGDLAAARRAGPGRVGTAIEAALGREAALALEEELLAVAAAEAANGTGVTCHEVGRS